MVGDKGKESKAKDKFILPLIVVGVFVIGLLGLSVLQKLSINNQRICKFLGRVWSLDEDLGTHRCFTYEELYSQN